MNDERSTPDEFFLKLNNVFGFDMDAAATVENTKCIKFINRERDAFLCPWYGNAVWCNPPYSRGQLERWLKRGIDEVISGHCSQLAFLTPGDFSTKWFQLIWLYADAVYFPSYRLAFDNEPAGAKFSNAVSVFGKLSKDQRRKLLELDGWVVYP